MKDGSDAVSDWPLLNALLNTAGGATWVSLHHGGGVGMGYSQHSGVVIVCDGSDAAAKRIERVLWNDPGTGVMRHADAGYDSAVACAKRAGPEAADDRGLSVELIVPGSCRSSSCAASMAACTKLGLQAASRERIRASAAVVQAAAAGDAPVYGVNTGFGKLANQRISAEQLDTLQLNLIRSHSVGVGEPLAPEVVRLMLALKAASLARGHSGVRERGDRHPDRGAQRRPGALCAGAGLGGRLGRPGAAGPHDAGAAGRGRDAGGRPAPPGAGSAAVGRHRSR